jgi:hypothetical protein
MLVYFLVIWNILPTAIWYILWPFGNVVVSCYIFPRLGILCGEKSGNPGIDPGSVVPMMNAPSKVELATTLCKCRHYFGPILQIFVRFSHKYV